MKLYANVIAMKGNTGKYVKKGQGSNQSLTIEILAEGLAGIPTRANIYRLSLNIDNINELQTELLDYSTGEKTQLTKAKKQKAERICGHCGCALGEHNDLIKSPHYLQ